MNKLIKVTVITSVLNEELNLKSFINALLGQKTKNIDLNIHIISDGSTDNTNSILDSISSKKLQKTIFKTRKGKAYRINNAIKESKSDILVIIDGDVEIKSRNLIVNLVSPFYKDRNIGMVGGNSKQANKTNFIEKAIGTSFSAYSSMRNKYNSLSVGPVFAIKKDFANKINIPNNIIGEDAFIYLSCLSNEFTYYYQKNAIVYFKVPNTLVDHIKQNVRFEASPIKMADFFSQKLINKESHIEINDLVISYMREFIKSPIHCLFIFFVNIYCKIVASQKTLNLTSIWEASKSTKNLKIK